MPVWVGMMVRAESCDEEAPQPVAVKLDAAIWDEELGLLPVLDRLDSSPNVMMITILAARNQDAARDEVYALYEAMMARVSGPMIALQEYMECAGGLPRRRNAKASIEEIEAAMGRTGGRREETAKALGISKSALDFHLRKPELRHWAQIKGERAHTAAMTWNDEG